MTPLYNVWWLRTATFLAAALVAASAAFWVLKVNAAAPEASPAQAIRTHAPQVDARVVARLLGGEQMASEAGPAAVQVAVAAQFKLVGVVAEGRRGGYALIAIDDQPARPYRVGAPVSDTLVLQSVAARSAALATDVRAPVSVQLTLPALAPAQGADAQPTNP